jgi:hypothetical protein
MSKPNLNLGILITTLYHSQLSHELTTSINSAIRGQKLLDSLTLFSEYKTFVPHMPMCANLHIYDAFGYEGILVSTNVSTTNKMVKMHGNHKKYWYMYNLEWLGKGPFSYESFAQLVTNPSMEIIARNHDHAALIYNSFNKAPKFILPSLNILELITLLSENES